MTELIKDLTPVREQGGASLNLMLKELQTLNIIALLKEEEFVIRSILHGKSISKVLEDLKKKYPKEKITRKDVDDFVLLYQDVLHNEKTDIEKAYVRRLIKSQDGLTNQLINLAIKARDMVDRYDEAGDNSNAVNALRAASDIFMKFAKVQGITNDQPIIDINVKMDKLVNEISTGNSDFKKKLMKFTEEKIVDVEVEEEDGTGN